jgi:hypothetical protein
MDYKKMKMDFKNMKMDCKNMKMDYKNMKVVYRKTSTKKLSYQSPLKIQLGVKKIV